jgi:hypothetical protein
MLEGESVLAAPFQERQRRFGHAAVSIGWGGSVGAAGWSGAG